MEGGAVGSTPSKGLQLVICIAILEKTIVWIILQRVMQREVVQLQKKEGSFPREVWMMMMMMIVTLTIISLFSSAAGQMAIQAFMSFSPEKTQQCHEALVLMCAIDNRPYYMVECHGFRYFINAISGGRYTPPSRATLRVMTASMAGQIKETTTTIITEDVKDGAVIHLTFDAWTDRYVMI